VPTEPLEARLTDVLLRFDGTVLELFDRGASGSARYHREFMPGLTADGGVLTINNPDKTYRVYGHSAEQGPALEALVAAALAARGSGAA
jgi:hypothetical protein